MIVVIWCGRALRSRKALIILYIFRSPEVFKCRIWCGVSIAFFIFSKYFFIWIFQLDFMSRIGIWFVFFHTLPTILSIMQICEQSNAYAIHGASGTHTHTRLLRESTTAIHRDTTKYARQADWRMFRSACVPFYISDFVLWHESYTRLLLCILKTFTNCFRLECMKFKWRQRGSNVDCGQLFHLLVRNTVGQSTQNTIAWHKRQ